MALSAFLADHAGALPALAGQEAVPPALWQAAATAGLFGLGLPAEFGGQGGGYAEIAAAEAALAEASGAPGLAMLFAGRQMLARFGILGQGSPAQQAALLPDLAAGRLTLALAISEPGRGAHPKLLETRARWEGETWVLQGEKTYVTNGPIAGLFIVLAITAEEAGRKRYGAFLVPRPAPGLSLHGNAGVTTLRPSGHCGLLLQGCRVPADALLGDAVTGYDRIALPFRDVEDMVGTSNLAGSLAHLLRLLGAGTVARSEAAAQALGGMAASLALLRQAAAELAAALDGQRRPHHAALLAGARLLASEVLERARAYAGQHVPAPPATLATLLADLQTLAGVARGPRLARLAKLGQGLFPGAGAP